jgi:hypothetical protein
MHAFLRFDLVDGAQRQNVFELLMMNGFFNLFAPFINTFNTIRRPNPDRNFTQEDFTSCLDRDGLMGNCLPATICQSHGGRPSGTCRIAAVCCISIFEYFYCLIIKTG